MGKIIIAIDGYSSCGKSTMAKQMAKELGYIYVDTGAMYRAVTLFALRNGFFKTGELNQTALINSLKDVKVTFRHNAELNISETCLNNENVEQEIRGIEVSNHVSKVAQVKEVRAKMIDLQREMGKEKGLIMDGRDIGSVVFPNAELKIFMTADYEIRAKRRFEELKAKGVETSYEDVLENINSRDMADTSRAENPLIKADDAVVIDNSNISQKEQLALALNYANAKINA